MASSQSISPSVFSQNSVFSPKSSPAGSSNFEELSPALLFPQAADLYIKVRSVSATGTRYVAQNTIKSYRRYAGALALFFASVPLNKITVNHLRDYQAARVQGAAPFMRQIRVGTCRQCGKPFELPRRRKQFYCAKTCQNKATKSRWNEGNRNGKDPKHGKAER